MKLEKQLFHQCRLGRREARRVIAAELVQVDGEIEVNPLRQVDEFTHIELDGRVVQAKQRHFFMVHKPVGYVSSVGHSQHPTVLDLLPPELREGMHYAGRLDLSTSGLMIVTNDGKWSRRLTEPDLKVPKVYRVTLESDLTPATHEQFKQGIYFAYEDVTTLPAELVAIGAREARLTLHEGKYHQVKRMFHAVGNRVTSLHRESVGPITLDLKAGTWRNLTRAEINWVSMSQK